jgi:hypothetical protein
MEGERMRNELNYEIKLLREMEDRTIKPGDNIHSEKLM